MELEFDKEIDALLRRSRPPDGRSASLNAATTHVTHLDADEIAAYSENAVPGSTRLRFTQHLADCDDCRSRLAFAVGHSLETATAVTTAVEPVDLGGVPWYRRLFSGPGLAVAFGGLILVFGGMLGFMMLSGGGDSNVASVFDTGAANSTNANAAMRSLEQSEVQSANAAASNSMSNTMASAPQSPDSSSTAPRTSAPAGGGRQDALLDGATLNGGEALMKPVAKAAAEAPPAPPPAVTDSTVGVTLSEAERSEKKADSDDAKEEVAQLQRQQNRNRDSLLMSPKQKIGPTARNQSQNQVQNLPEPARSRSARTVGGKTFTRRDDGGWYDASFTGQAMTNVRRGTEQFRKLDDGLRNIANSLDGIVVVIWKSKAYRIQ